MVLLLYSGSGKSLCSAAGPESFSFTYFTTVCNRLLRRSAVTLTASHVAQS